MRLVRAVIVPALAAAFVLSAAPDGIAQTDRAAVVKTYADIGEAMYEDALAAARVLQKAVRALVAMPGEATLQAAREAWLAARVPYQQTEVYRFGNAIVDDWEGRVNAWPLDEGLIDYVDARLRRRVATRTRSTPPTSSPTRQLKIGGEEVDASDDHAGAAADTPAGGRRRRGQRRHRLSRHRVPALGAGPERHRRRRRQAAVRPTSTRTSCTGGNCDRRAHYLKAATDLLVADLA